MDLGLKGKVALVAAASKGLGKAVAMELASEGARVAICARNEDTLRAAADEIGTKARSEVLAVVADVTVAEDVEGLVADTLTHFHHIDILVNNAGGPPAGYFLDFGDEDWQAAFELNLLSTVRLIRAVLPGMRQRRWGRVVNITSVAVKQPVDNLILSNAGRSGVVGLAKTLATQLAAEGITVNNVCPGYTLTDRVRSLAQAQAQRDGLTTDQVLARFANDVPMARLGQPEELAALVAFLASERAGYITGQSIAVDGGYVRGSLG